MLDARSGSGPGSGFWERTRSILAALNDSLPPDVARRVAVAHENSWASRIEAMSRLVDAAIERRAGGEQRWDETLLRVYRRTRSRGGFLALPTNSGAGQTGTMSCVT